MDHVYRIACQWSAQVLDHDASHFLSYRLGELSPLGQESFMRPPQPPPEGAV